MKVHGIHLTQSQLAASWGIRTYHRISFIIKQSSVMKKSQDYQVLSAQDLVAYFTLFQMVHYIILYLYSIYIAVYDSAKHHRSSPSKS